MSARADLAPEADLERRLQAMVGHVYGPVHAWDEVNLPMIRHWCAATGNVNPAYLDPASPAALRRGGLVAPPTMLQVWMMPGLGGQAAPGSAVEGLETLLALLAQDGYTASVGVNSEQEYRRYVRPGERLHCVTTVSAISPRKVTAVGAGYFVTLLLDIRSQDGETVGTMHFRQLVYRPEAATDAPVVPDVAKAADAGAVVNSPAPPAATLVAMPRTGDALPTLSIPVTLTSIVAGAIATRDFHPVHHDVEATRQLGMPTIFMNILTTNACIERHVYAWAGERMILEAVTFKLGTPNFAGDVMTMSGSVLSVDDMGRIELALRGVNSRGTHLDAKVRLRMA